MVLSQAFAFDAGSTSPANADQWSLDFVDSNIAIGDRGLGLELLPGEFDRVRLRFYDSLSVDIVLRNCSYQHGLDELADDRSRDKQPRDERNEDDFPRNCAELRCRPGSLLYNVRGLSDSLLVLGFFVSE